MTMTRTRDRLRQLLTVALVVLMAAALLPLRAVSAAAQDERGHGSPSVQITAPTTADPITVAPGGALEVTFEANRRWRYELSVRASGGGWVSPGGAASGPVDRHSANVAEITVPEDMPLGVADLRVRLLTPAGVERAVDVAAAAIEITVEPEPPTTVFTTDFKEDEHRVGEPPVGWSEFRLPGSWAIRNAPRRLEAAIAPGGRQGLMWDVPGDGGIVEGDVEVAGLVRGQTTGNALFQLALHASGDGTDYYYVDAWPANGNIRINRFVGDSFSTLRSAPAGVPVSNGIWYQVVVRREGDVLSAKLWPFGEPEPAGWQVSVTDATHHRGQVGVTHLNEGTVNDWAWFSVALAGEHAERAPDDVFDPDPDAEVTAVEVTPDTVAVEIGDTLALAATAHYDDGAAVDVTTTATWTSADTEVATVSATGVVTGVAEGTTEITAAVDGVAGTATVTVVEQLPPTTGFEDRGGDGWTTHSEELAFLEEVDDRSDRVAISVVGETVQGRPLHLVRVGYPEAPDDAEIAAGHSVLVVGSQHGNEPAGREAALQHLRDLAFSEDPEVLARLETITMLYIPTANPDGRVANTRGNADGIDTNRDHHRLATAEATAVAEAVTRFDPEIVIDLHERPSDSAPDVELLWPRNLNVDESLRQLTVELVQEHLRPALEDAGFSTGLYGSPTGAGDGDERIARNVFGLRHKLGLLSETAGQDPPLARVDAHHLTVEQTLAFFAARRDDVEAETTGAAARRQAHGAARGVFYLDGRDDVSPPPADGIVDPGPCGYVLSPAEVARIERHIELFGIATETTDDGRALLRMDQPMMTIIPFLVDPRAFSPLANGLVADDCDDLPDPPQPAVVSTSFTEPEHVVGDKPVGWRRFRTDGGWAVRNLPRRLEATIGPGGRQGLMWSEPGNLGLVEGDVEVAGLVRGQTTGNALFQL
ncbi:MAG TPA: M14 family zinc carboxypeptidase, partial [Egibacteraceae bacterium]